jgi:transposase
MNPVTIGHGIKATRKLLDEPKISITPTVVRYFTRAEDLRAWVTGDNPAGHAPATPTRQALTDPTLTGMSQECVRIAKYAPNRMPTVVKKKYFEFLREGYRGAAAARRVGVSTSCGSLWFIDAGSMIVPDPGPISPRFLTQDDRIAIADGLHAQQTVKQIAESIGKSFQTVYREIKRNSKPDGRYTPWWAHNQALLRRHRPKEERRSGPASRCGLSCARSSPRNGHRSRSPATWPASTPTTR